MHKLISTLKVEDNLHAIADARTWLSNEIFNSSIYQINIDVSSLRADGSPVSSINGGKSSGAWRFTLDILNILKQFNHNKVIVVQINEDHEDLNKLYWANKMLKDNLMYHTYTKEQTELKDHNEFKTKIQTYIEGDFYSDWNLEILFKK